MSEEDNSSEPIQFNKQNEDKTHDIMFEYHDQILNKGFYD